MTKLKGALVFCAFLLFFQARSQDIELDNIAKQKPFQATGGVSLLNRFYGANGIENRQDPYLWTLRANLNLSIFGVATPLSATITSQNTDFNQPYNRISIRPHYKWARGYFGYANMTYSSYTLAGHTFLGAGVELNPGKIRVAANYGRFAEAIPFDKPVNEPFVPAFNRRGYGAKVGYGTDQNFIDVMFFRGFDDEDSWSTIPDTTTVFPAENIVFGTAFRLSVIKNLVLNGEFGHSIYTIDKRDEKIDDGPAGFDIRSSTVQRNAIKFGATYRIKTSNINGLYERIDPNYRSMGAYFFNNDIENITLGFTTAILKKRLALNINAGTQRNNLRGDKLSTNDRTIASANIVYTQQGFTIGFLYSNYSSQVEFVLNSTLDSLNAVIVTQSGTINAGYAFKPKGPTTHMINVTGSVQDVTNDFTGQRGGDNGNITGVFNYTLGLTDRDFTLTTRFNYNRNDIEGIINERYGPGITARKYFLKKRLNTSFSFNYFDQGGNATWNTVLQAMLSIAKHHTAILNASRIRRVVPNVVDGGQRRYDEFIVAITYNYTF